MNPLLLFFKPFNHLYCLVRGILLRRFYLPGLAETGLPGAERLLVVAPHMDDEAIGCAGMIALAVQKGIEVTLVYLTDGAHALTGEAWREINEKRIAESRAAMQILGVEKLYFLQQPDGQVDISAAARQLTFILELERPQQIYFPYDHDDHTDHRAAAAVVLQACGKAQPALFMYQIRVPIPASLIRYLLDIAPVHSLKQKAQACFVSQAQIRFDLYNHLQECQYYLRWHRGGHAEVFAPYDPQALHCDSRSLTAYRQIFRRALQVPENDLLIFLFTWLYNHSVARINLRLGLRSHGPFYFWVIYRMHDPWHLETNPYETMKFVKTLESLRGKSFARALEVGCGSGVFTEQLAPRCTVLEGIDVARGACAQARARCRHLENVQIRTGDFFDLPPQPRYDLLVCAEILYFFWDPPALRLRARGQIDRLLIRGGLLLVVWGGIRLTQEWDRFLSETGTLRLLHSGFHDDARRPYRIALLEKI